MSDPRHHAAGPAGATSAPSKAAQAGGKQFSAAARKDPALLPLAFCVVAGLSTAAYFFSSKWSSASKPDQGFASVSGPWENKNSNGSSQLYKYRYMNKQGKMENAAPATSSEVYPVTGNIDRLRAFSKHDEE